MDLSKPDTLCVYCGTDLKELARAKELLQEMADAVKEDPDYDDLHYKATAFLNRRSYPLDTEGLM
jgi:hypothetical protein